jgi:hypothetical protein
MLVLVTSRLIHFACAALSIKSRIDSSVLREPKGGKIVNGEMRARARHSRLKLTDVIQQRLRRVFPLSLHALADSHEQPRSPLRETEALLLVGLDILCVGVCERAYRSGEVDGLRGKG